MFAFVVLALGLTAAPAAPSEDSFQESLDAIDQLTLEDVLNTSTGVASKAATGLREAPGIVTVITREEIVRSGARDLADLLQRVPGFALAQDTTGVVGVGFRGNWGFEGKILFLLDGHELNESLYLSMPLGSHLLAEQIERVEVIRGPGSAVYGGYAELAVVSITTRTAESLHGASASARYSLLPNASTWGRRSLTLAWGDTFDAWGPLRVSVGASLGEAHRSGQEQDDVLGQRFSMTDNSMVRPTLFTVNADWRDLHVGFAYDDYRYLDRTGYDEALSRPVWGRYESYLVRGSYDLHLPHGFKLTPRLAFKHQTPWQVTEREEEFVSLVAYDRSAERWDASLALTWEPLSWLTLQLGGGYTHDQAWVNDDFAGLFSTGESVQYDNFAGYVEVSSRKFVDVTAGARLEHHSSFGTSFVPRLALTKVYEGFHAKALVAQSFRAPGIENISTNPDIKPERGTTYELELGYLFLPSLFASLSVFKIDITDPILYEPHETYDLYVNGARSGACGLEAEVRLKGRPGWASLGYSFYTAGWCAEQPEQFSVPGHDDAVLGFANHKVVLTGALEVLPSLDVSPTITFFSRRWYLDAEGAPALTPASVLVDLFVTYRGKALRGLSVGVGVHNLLAQKFDYLQPYAGGKLPMRGFDRELTLRVGYDTP